MDFTFVQFMHLNRKVENIEKTSKKLYLDHYIYLTTNVCVWILFSFFVVRCHCLF